MNAPTPSTSDPARPIEIFIAYARRDEGLRDELKNHLGNLRHGGQITIWYDRAIPPGKLWKKEIDEHLNTAQIILLLISSDFIGSKYCYSDEMTRALERHREGKARVIPIILRPVDWEEDTPISPLQALPTDGKAITSWPDRDEAFRDVAKGIRRSVAELRGTQQLTSALPAVPDSQPESTSSIRASNQSQTASLPAPVPPLAAPSFVSPQQSVTSGSGPSQPVSPPGSSRVPAPTQLQMGSSPTQLLSQLPVKVKVGLSILLIIFLLASMFHFVPLPFSLPTPLCNITVRPCPSVTPEIPSGTGVTKAGISSGIGVTKVGSEYIGISDGRFPFDIGNDRPDGHFKLEAAGKLIAGDIPSAVSNWKLGLQQKANNSAPETNDAEALIYLEDQRVLASHQPYITFIVATFLTGENAKVGRDDLQGAYVAQKEFNSNSNFALPNGVQVRLLIANSGSDNEANATGVAQQIVQAAQQDHTIVGVMGWPYSQSSINAIKVLAAAHIPLVSQGASSDLLTKKSSYFFRVNPPDKQQGTIGAQYAEQQLHAKRVALFVDPDNPYSRSLAQAFCQAFTGHIITNPESNDFCLGSTQNGNAIVAVEFYMKKNPKTVGTHLQDALNTAPDLIYLAGYAPEAGILLDLLAKDAPALKLMGGDGFYDLKKYPSDGYPLSARDHLYFTEFAYPDEWRDLPVQKPPFFEDYSRAFDPDKHYQDNTTYGYNRASAGVMLSYDAMLALLNASKTALAGGKTLFGSSDLQQALTEITGKQAIQGVSGQISFGPDGNPIDKTVVVLRVERHGYTIELSKQCRFLLTDAPQCVNPTS